MSTEAILTDMKEMEIVVPKTYVIKEKKKDQLQISSNSVPKIAAVYNYFLVEVDPLINMCISHLLILQPTDVLSEMLFFFKSIIGKKKEDILISTSANITKHEQKLYLDTVIGPVITKLVNKIAAMRPKVVLDFICNELSIMISKQ